MLLKRYVRFVLGLPDWQIEAASQWLICIKWVRYGGSAVTLTHVIETNFIIIAEQEAYIDFTPILW